MLRLPRFDAPTILAATMNDSSADSRATVHREGRHALVVFGVIEILIGLTLAAMAPLSILAGFFATSVDLWVVVPSVVLYCAMASAFIALGVGVIRARQWARALSLSLGWVWLLTGISTLVFVWLFTPTLWSDLARSSGLSRTAAEWLDIGINVFLIVVYVLLPGAFVLFFRSPRTVAACRRHDPNPGWAGRCPQRLLALAVAYALGGLSVLAMPAYGFVFPLFGSLLSGLAGAVLWTGVLLLAGVLTWGTCRRRVWAWRLAVIATVAAAASCAVTFAVVTPESVFAATGLPVEQRFLIDDFWPSAPWIHVTFWLAVWGSLLGYLFVTRPLFDISTSAETDAGPR